MQLYNTLSAEERKQLIEESGRQRLTLSFYAYAHIENPQEFRDNLFRVWDSQEVLGRIYVAHEGINAQLSVPADRFDEFKAYLDTYDFMNGMRLNIAVEQDDLSFLKLTVKVRHKIVADGLDDASFDVTNKGIHLKASEFNKLLEDPNTIVVDFRNHYESEVGHFKGAITPDVDTFRESLPIIEEQLSEHKEDKNLLMYCTGGIRCEKASAYFKHKGFKNVYQLEGGIIEYARQVKTEGLESKFLGTNFVFDHRLGERITDDIIARCHQCGEPCDTHTNCANDSCHLLFIQCEKCTTVMEGCCSNECVDVIHLPLAEQIALRKGKMNGNKIFKKGKSPALKFKTLPTDEVIAKVQEKERFLLRRNDKKNIKKQFLGKATHYYTSSGISEFTLSENINKGDVLVIIGPTTGEQKVSDYKMVVNNDFSETAKPGDKITIKLPFRTRLSDKLYKIIT